MGNIIYKIKDNSLLIRKTSSIINAIFGIFKIISAIFSKSILLFIYSFYNIGMAIAKRTSVRKKEKYKYENFYLVGLIVIISSIAYIIYSIYMYFNGSEAKYHMVVAIGIATISFYNIIEAVIGIIRAKKNNNIQMETIKLTNLASASISLSLTQTALLSFTLSDANTSQYYAIGGIFFGSLAAIVGIYMIVYTFYYRKKCNKFV